MLNDGIWLARALQNLRPGATWTLSGDTYAGIAWLDQAQSRPSKAEVAAKMAELKARGTKS